MTFHDKNMKIQACNMTPAIVYFCNINTLFCNMTLLKNNNFKIPRDQVNSMKYDTSNPIVMKYETETKTFYLYKYIEINFVQILAKHKNTSLVE